MHSSPTPCGIGRSESKLRIILSCTLAAFLIAAYSPSGAAAQSKSDALDAAEEAARYVASTSP